MSESKPNGDTNSRFVEWLFAQGTSTVLLVLLVLGLWFAVPKMLDRHDEAIQRTQESFDKSLTEQRTDFKAIIDKCCRDDRKS